MAFSGQCHQWPPNQHYRGKERVMGWGALVMRKSTRAHQEDPSNELITFQSPALWGVRMQATVKWVQPLLGPYQARLLSHW